MMATHIVTSHGSDFFGEDRHPVKVLRDLGQHVRGVLPYDDQRPVLDLLEFPGARPVSLDPDQAAVVAQLFRTAAGHRSMARKFAGPARLLGDAAARAAADGETWTWTPISES
jgi:hypothetical protein